MPGTWYLKKIMVYSYWNPQQIKILDQKSMGVFLLEFNMNFRKGWTYNKIDTKFHCLHRELRDSNWHIFITYNDWSQGIFKQVYHVFWSYSCHTFSFTLTLYFKFKVHTSVSISFSILFHYNSLKKGQNIQKELRI